MAEDIHDALARTLADIRTRLGADAFEDRRKVLALLSDMLPGATRQIRLLGIAIDNGAVRALAASRPDQAALEIDRHAQRVDADLGIRKAVMVPVLRAVAYAVGRGFMPSSYAPEAASEVVVRPAAREEEWVGLASETPTAPPPRASARLTPGGPAPPPPDLRVIAPAPRAPAPAQAVPSGAVSPRAAVSAPVPAPPTVPVAPPLAPAGPPQPVAGTGPVGRGGWLIAWMAWLGLELAYLVFFGVRLALRLLNLLLSDESLIVHEGMIVLPILMLGAAAMGVAVLWLYIDRSKYLRFAYPAWLLVLAGLTLYADGLRMTDIEHDFVEFEVWLLPLPFLVFIGGVVYFMRSRRVRNTFVR